jgi:hypothetical protein
MGYTSYLGVNIETTRGIRNNNPANLIYTSIPWEGKIQYSQNNDWEGTPTNIKRKFEQFKELRYGIRALMRDLISDHKKGKTSVVALISEFAPAFENNTPAYIQFVINGIGAAVIPEMTEERLVSLCKAIIAVENGASVATKFVKEKDYRDALNILGLPLKKKII